MPININKYALSRLHAFYKYLENDGTLQAFNRHLENKMNHCFFYILYLHLILYYKATPYDIAGKLIYHKIGKHNRSGSLNTG